MTRSIGEEIRNEVRNATILQWLATYCLPIALLINMGAVLTLVAERSVLGTIFTAESQPLGIRCSSQDAAGPTGGRFRFANGGGITAQVEGSANIVRRDYRRISSARHQDQQVIFAK